MQIASTDASSRCLMVSSVKSNLLPHPGYFTVNIVVAHPCKVGLGLLNLFLVIS